MQHKIAIFSILATLQIYAMNCSQWGGFEKRDNHWYTITHDKLTFSNAQTIAEKEGGYLAIPDSEEENKYLASITTRDAAWIGIYDPSFEQNYCYIDRSGCVSNDTRYKTVKGGPLKFKNWNNGEPNNAVYDSDFIDGRALVAPIGEYWVIIGAAGKWADVGNHVSGNAEEAKYQAIFEFDQMPECATGERPESNPLNPGSGEKKCNTEVYNKDLNITVPGQTFTCQTDQSGNDYCPYMLAECGQEWDYYPSTAEEQTNTIQLYAELEAEQEPIPPIGKNFVVSWWWCDTCSYKTNMLNTMLPVIQKAGGTFIKTNGKAVYRNNSIMYAVEHDAKNPFYIQLNNGSYLTIAPGEVFWMFYKGMQNQAGQTISAGGKPYVYFSTTNQCSNLQLVPKTKDYPTHYACIDSENEDLTCPPNTAESYIDGHLTCFGENIVYSCPDGYIQKDNQCVKDVTYTYYEYVCKNGGDVVNSGGDCGGSPLIDTDGDGVGDSCNSPTPPEQNCKKEKYVCKSDASRLCVKVDNKMQCSPFPCFGSGDIENYDTTVGLNDKNNDGWTVNGDCAGKIYIFNGADSRCRSKIAGGVVDDCCKHDNFLFGMIDCSDKEAVLDAKKEAEQCHYVGEYCSQKVFGACVTKKKTYCCFNSKLGRIIVEEGRKQLKNLDWGSAKNPNCRGFSPEEFQKIDFSRIDLTEFTDDLQNQINTNNIQNLSDRMQEKIQMMQGY